MTATAPSRNDERQLLLAIPVCLVTTIAVAFGVLESPYGSLFMFDDSFSPGNVIAPVAAGVLTGLLQSLTFSPRAALLGALVVAVVGGLSVVFVYPAATCAAGCALGAGIGAIIRRLWGRPRVPVLLLAGVSVVAVGSWFVR